MPSKQSNRSVIVMNEVFDKYGNTEDRIINCCFPDCGCAGARNCMAENGAHNGALTLNREPKQKDTPHEIEQDRRLYE